MSHARSKARRCAVQALYQWQMTGEDVGAIVQQFIEERGTDKLDAEYFEGLLQGTINNLDDLDQQLSPLLDRGINSVDPVERSVLRLGVYELIHQPEVPYKVVINEALEAAKIFGAELGYKYVNGVLDKAAKILRPTENKRGKK